MAAAAVAAADAGSPALLSSSALTSSASLLLDTTRFLVAQTRNRWTHGELDLNDGSASTAAQSSEVETLKETIASQIGPTAWPAFRDIAAAELRHLLAATLGDQVRVESSRPPVDVPTLLNIYAFLDVTTAYQQAELVDGGLALTFIEEINERLTVDSACQVFEYLESRADVLTQDVSPSRGKGLVLLRLLNDLLRRLSKPSRSHLVLSGRILSLLSAVFPLGDRSGVNLRGEFNTANVTRIEEQQQHGRDDHRDGDEDEDDEARKDADPSALAARDDSFYTSFWGLQRYFSNPTLLFEPVATVEEPELSANNDSAARAAIASRDPIEKVKVAEQGGDTGSGDRTRSSSSSKSRGGTPQAQAAATTPAAATEDTGKDHTDNANADGEQQASTPAAATPHRERSEEGAAEGDGHDGEPGEASSSSSSLYVPPVPPLESFKDATRRVLDVFAEASSREREVEQAERAANKSTTSTAAAKKRKREEMLQSHVGAELSAVASTNGTDNYHESESSSSSSSSSFPKYLTGRRVFEYQLRSPPFRRHVLLQFLILFQYLLSFSEKEKEKSKDWKNQQLLLAQPLANDFVLESGDEKWIRASWREIVNLLEETGPRSEGRGFKTSALQTLRRESRWISWKAENCPAIDKPGLKQDVIDRFLAGARTLLDAPRPTFPHSVGTQALSELWEDGLEPIVAGTRRREDDEGNEIEVKTDGLEQLELPPGIPSLATYAKMIKMQEMKETMRLRKLGIDPADKDAVAKQRQADDEVRTIRERIDSLNWRALRVARGGTLRLWSKIGTGEVQLLLDAEKAEEEAAKRKAEVAEQQQTQQQKVAADGGAADATAASEKMQEDAASTAKETTNDTKPADQDREPDGNEDAVQGTGTTEASNAGLNPTVTEAVDVPNAAVPAAAASAAATPVPIANAANTPGGEAKAEDGSDEKAHTSNVVADATTTTTEESNEAAVDAPDDAGAASTEAADASVYVDASAEMNVDEDEEHGEGGEAAVDADVEMAQANSGNAGT